MTFASSVGGPGSDAVAQIVERPGASAQCRCGTRLGTETLRYELVGVPRSVRGILEGRSFCSHRCVRAFFLETMETFDGMSATTAAAMVSDLHQVYLATVRTFARLLEDPGSAG